MKIIKEEKSGLKLKAGQEVILENGSRAVIEEGDSIVEEKKMKILKESYVDWVEVYDKNNKRKKISVSIDPDNPELILEVQGFGDLFMSENVALQLIELLEKKVEKVKMLHRAG